MHLRNYPQYFVKDGERIAVYYTADARDLKAQGWKPEETKKPAPEPVKPAAKPEKIEAELVIEEEPESPKPEFEFMTRTELLAYALERGVDLPNNSLKAELVEACKKL